MTAPLHRTSRRLNEANSPLRTITRETESGQKCKNHRLNNNEPLQPLRKSPRLCGGSSIAQSLVKAKRNLDPDLQIDKPDSSKPLLSYNASTKKRARGFRPDGPSKRRKGADLVSVDTSDPVGQRIQGGQWLQLQKDFVSQRDPDHRYSAREDNRSKSHHTRKRSREVEHPNNRILTKKPRKRLNPAQKGFEQTLDQGVGSHIGTSHRSHISHWIKEQVWPTELFQADSMLRALARKKSEVSLRRKRSEASFTAATTPSDQKTENNAPYKDPGYETELGRKAGSFMNEYELGVTDTSETLCQTLLDNKQTIPSDTIFGDNVFRKTCEKLRGKNEARILKDITPLIVPSVEPLATLSSKPPLDIAVESVNEGWNNSFPLTNPRPQPDYAVGFGRSAFSNDQLAKLQPFVGENTSYASLFLATYYMYFPFLTCEVKCGSIGLDVADRQNLHSMTLAVRGIVELFRLVNRAEELHREVLGFSVSHDQETVRIYGHFPVIEGTKTTYWRYPLRKYDITERKPKKGWTERWTAYTFTKNVYEVFMPIIFQKICSAINDLPLQFSEDMMPHISEHSGNSQQFEVYGLSEAGHQSNQLHQITPDTSIQSEKPDSKKKRIH